MVNYGLQSLNESTNTTDEYKFVAISKICRFV